MSGTLRHTAAVCAVCVLFAACSRSAPTAAPNGSTSPTSANASANAAGSNWTANGATACDTYLTPAVVAEILKTPAGHGKRLSAWSCAYETADGNIDITLMAVGTAGLDLDLKNLPDPTPLAGVGDKAVRTMLGIEAAKGTNRMCNIDVMPPFAAKVSGEALAQKLGAICNQLFALP
jgi:hypothetical protein